MNLPTRTPTVAAGLLTPAVTAAAVLLAVVSAPWTLPVWLAGRMRAAHRHQAGVSEIAVIALLTGLAALLVVGYMNVIADKVTAEANNLPGSTGP